VSAPFISHSNPPQTESIFPKHALQTLSFRSKTWFKTLVARTATTPLPHRLPMTYTTNETTLLQQTITPKNPVPQLNATNQTLTMSSSEPSSVDSTDTNYRYAAYANRIRTILLSAHRYVAYTSDIGESFRPVAHPWLVRSAYGISWAYLIGDVSHEGYKAYLRNRRALVPPGETYKDASELPQDQIIRGMATGNIAGPLNGEQEEKSTELRPWAETDISLAEDYRMVMVKRAVFQGIASMGLPAFTIHSVVKYSGKMVKGAKSTLMRTWLPIGVCLFLSSFFFFSSSCSCACALGLVDVLTNTLARSRSRSYPALSLRSPCGRSSRLGIRHCTAHIRRRGCRSSSAPPCSPPSSWTRNHRCGLSAVLGRVQD
jgi:hypothetical protein